VRLTTKPQVISTFPVRAAEVIRQRLVNILRQGSREPDEVKARDTMSNLT
jgi:hypothetical protein